MSLCPVIGELQKLRQEYAKLEHPRCADNLYQADLDVMNAYEDAFLAFMANQGDYIVNLKLDRAERLVTYASDALEDVWVATGTPMATRTPTLTPVPRLIPEPAQTPTPAPTWTDAPTWTPWPTQTRTPTIAPTLKPDCGTIPSGQGGIVFVNTQPDEVRVSMGGQEFLVRPGEQSKAVYPVGKYTLTVKSSLVRDTTSDVEIKTDLCAVLTIGIGRR